MRTNTLAAAVSLFACANMLADVHMPNTSGVLRTAGLLCLAWFWFTSEK